MICTLNKSLTVNDEYFNLKSRVLLWETMHEVGIIKSGQFGMQNHGSRNNLEC